MRADVLNRTFTVLMVDDDKDDIYTVRRGIQSSRSRIAFFAVSCAEELFARLVDSSKTLPDVLVLDINIPRMNGFEILEQLKSHDVWAQIPVMVFSTSSHTADRIRAKDLGAMSFATKFSSMKDLENWVSDLDDFLQSQI